MPDAASSPPTPAQRRPRPPTEEPPPPPEIIPPKVEIPPPVTEDVDSVDNEEEEINLEVIGPLPLGDPRQRPIRGSTVFNISVCVFVCLYVGNLFCTLKEIGKMVNIG